MAGFTEDRHKAIGKVTQTWGKDTSATDKALRNCILGTALSAIENMRIKHGKQLDALTEVSTAAFSGYALGRGSPDQHGRPTRHRRPTKEECNPDPRTIAVLVI